MTKPNMWDERNAREWKRDMAALTPAERAVFDELPFGAIPGPSDAVAVVAAVRPLIYREAAAAISTADGLRIATDDHMGDIEMAAEWLARRADEMGDDRG